MPGAPRFGAQGAPLYVALCAPRPTLPLARPLLLLRLAIRVNILDVTPCRNDRRCDEVLVDVVAEGSVLRRVKVWCR